MSTTLKNLISDANSNITSHTADHAATLIGNEGVVFVDVREQAELDAEGTIPGAIHKPRGLLEFLIDQGSPMFDPLFSEDKEFIFYCKLGGRGALAAKTAQDLGVKRTANIVGGYNAWTETQAKT